jgi:DNA-binding transcriptional regulator YdaS (Cro superfamily)
MDMKKDPALIDLIVRAGSMSDLGRSLGVSRSAVHYWRQVPIRHILAIEKIYGIPRQALRPDLYGDDQGKEKDLAGDRALALAERSLHG